MRIPFPGRHAGIGLVWQFAIAFSVMMLVVGAFLYAGVRNYAENNIQTSSQALMSTERAAVFGKVDAVFAQAERIVLGNAALARHGSIPLNEEQRLSRFFLEQVRQEPSIDFLFFSNEQGGIASGGTDFGEFRLIYTNGMKKGVRVVERVDASGTFLARLPPPLIQDYDPREQPWYLEAKQERRLIWDQASFGTVWLRLTLAVANPLIGPSGEIKGVFGGNVQLDSLGSYLESHRTSPNAHLMLVESGGDLVANSSGAPLVSVQNGVGRRLKAETVPQPLAREAAGLVRRMHESQTDSVSTQMQDDQGRAYYVDIAPYVRGRDIRWYLVTVVPRSDVAGTLDILWSNFLLILLGGAAGAVGLSFVMAGWVTRPMRAINEGVKQLAAGNFGSRVETRRRDEIGQLVQSFNDMSGRLAGTYEEIRRKNAELQREIAERRQAEAERNKTEERLRQAQKMEAIGNLAGGIAHDFNNLLSVILGYSGLMLPGMDPDDKFRAGVEQIDRAGLRAAALTQQLLAFSRKQLLQPRIIRLSDVVAGVESMLRRLIGENIGLTVRGSRELGCVRADPSHMEQVIMNLAVNSRDAMPGGGTLIIETANVDLDQAHAARVGANPGPYVMLAVTDNGIGMDSATQARIFEPFFTTKEVGKGTGLGLATVFGIVQQSGGSISVDSEPGRGTTFCVYLPRLDETGESERENRYPVPGALEGSETILLVEDEEQVRTLVRAILQRFGYRVIEAQTGGDALLMSEKHAGTIDLLLTDVIMPHISGPQLAQRLGPLVRKVLYMSGYTEDSMVRQGLIDSSVALLQKPITPEALARKVREALDSPTDAFRPPVPRE